MRADNRLPEQLRPSRITPNFLVHAEGSVLVEAGRTKVICTASVEDRVPPFRRNSGKGWVTAEYGMLPRATSTRTQREASAGRVGGRTQEIQRLIGRSLRAVTSMEELGERTITLDCDVIQADGGTRTASITGAFVALVLALQQLRERDVLRTMPVTDFVAATSVGIVDGEPLLDLAYAEDSQADVDMNVVKTGGGLYVEVQGTAEALPFGREALNRLLDLADTGIRQLVALQRGLVGQYLATSSARLRAVTRLRHAARRHHQPGQGARDSRGSSRDVPVSLLTLRDCPAVPEPVETGDTFEANARLKAEYYDGAVAVAAARGAAGRACSRWPRIRAWSSTRSTASLACTRRASCARRAGYPERFAAIQARLAERPAAPRTARFVCALAVVEPEAGLCSKPAARWRASSREAPGRRRRFGYDPISSTRRTANARRGVGRAEARRRASRPGVPSLRAVARGARLVNSQFTIHNSQTGSRGP